VSDIDAVIFPADSKASILNSLTKQQPALKVPRI